MKTQRRHELKESDLSHALDVARTYVDEHGKRIALAIVVVGAVVIGTALSVRSQGAAIEDHWRQKDELRFDDVEIGRESLDVLANLIDTSRDEQFLLTGLIDLGQQALRLAGQVDVPPDREFNDTARDAFEQLLGRFGDNPLAVGVAHLGLATVEENLFTVDRSPSRKTNAANHLTAIIEDPALDGIPFKRMAMDRRAALDSTFTPVIFAEPPAGDPVEPRALADDAIQVIPAPFAPTSAAPDTVESKPANLDQTGDAETPTDDQAPQTDPGNAEDRDGDPPDSPQ